MAVPAALADVLQRADVWRGDSLARVPEAGVPTGHTVLDAELPGGGWSRGDLTELLGEGAGIGELSLLMPTLARLSASGGWLALVAPPWRPHAPAWAARGIRLERLVVMNPGQGRKSGQEMAWCCEQLLASGCFAAVLAWLDGASNQALSPSLLRRLQVAASGRGALAFLWRPGMMAASASPAPLRLQFEMARQGLGVRILKRRGGPASRSLFLSVPCSSRLRKKPHALVSPAFPPATAERTGKLVLV